MSVSGNVLRQGTHADPTEESVVPQNAFGLQNDVPDAILDPEWHALVRQHAQTLAGMLQHLQTAVAEGQRRPDAHWLQALVTDAEQLLTVQAQQHVCLERELVQLRALVTDVSQAPAELTERVQRLECVLEVLHAHLATARQYLATLIV